MPTRRGTATWEGGLKNGKGHLASASGAVKAPYSFGMRFGDEPGTNPEELLAAAHAGCYSMALGIALEKEGHAPDRIDTSAACSIEPQGEGFRITKMALQVRARVPGIDPATFDRVAAVTKEACPVSRALIGNMEITLDAQLA
jgi:lipoyl-dependent peroxiredoxin